MLTKRHHLSLTELYISSKDTLMKDSALISIGNCFNLIRLCLSNIEFCRPLWDIIDQLDRIEFLMIGFHDYTLDCVNFLGDRDFLKPKLSLKKLRLNGLGISNQFIKSVINK